jgi:hypothetical protein
VQVTEPELNRLEKAVLEAMAAREPTHSQVLKLQTKDIAVAGRENSGAGFFTRLSPVHRQNRLEVRVIDPGVAAEIEGLENPMVFVLFADKDGLVSTLEGASVAEGTMSIDFSKASFKII